ncbi:MAG: ABC transporter ATP-binding protein [Intestinibacter sp.]
MQNNSKQESHRILNMFKLMKKLKPYRIELVFAILSGICQHALTISASALSAYIVGLAIKGELLERAPKLLTILGILVVTKAIMYYSDSFLSHDVAYKILAQFRIDLYDAVEKVSPAILLNMRSGQLASTLMSDVELLEWFFAHTFGVYIVSFIVPVAILIFMGTLSIYLPLVMIFFIIVTVLVPFVLKDKADAQGKLVREKLADANSVSVEGVHGMKEILTLNYKEKYREKNARYMKDLYDHQLVYGKRLGTEGGVLHLCVGIAMICIAIVSIWLVFTGQLEFEWYSTIVILSVLTFNPIMEISNMARNFGLIVAASNRVFKVLESEPLVKDNGENIDIDTLAKNVSFENVSFKYRDDLDYAIKDVSFDIKPGEMVALVGHSGAGKSTCINLLLRYWDVNEGSIKIGGKDLRELSLDNIRNLTSAVLQDVYLFNISIKENIRLGNLNATDEEVISAAKQAFAHDFIMDLPDGYDTNVGERGTQLSGGQRQRIAIARALLKNSPILILDEAVSSLDTENEKKIQESLDEVYKDRTTLVVAHRLSTIMSADKLVVIDDGKVIQVGSHDELIKQDGFYKQLVSSQFTKNKELIQQA